MSLEERFWLRIAKPDSQGCWEWTGGKQTEGYGQFYVGGRERIYVVAHRFAYELLVGPIPEGLTLDHLCRNTSCVNPAHLEPVTAGENVLRGVGLTAQNAVKTHCDHGHEFTPENTYWRNDERGGRHCRVCGREATRRYKHRRQLNEVLVA